jgi:hypothetical protein
MLLGATAMMSTVGAIISMNRFNQAVTNLQTANNEINSLKFQFKAHACLAISNASPNAQIDKTSFTTAEWYGACNMIGFGLG